MAMNVAVEVSELFVLHTIFRQSSGGAVHSLLLHLLAHISILHNGTTHLTHFCKVLRERKEIDIKRCSVKRELEMKR